MPAHRASAVHAAPPTGVPSSRAQRVSTIGVTGWWAAKPCSQPGIVSTGTNALLAYGRNITTNVKPFATSGDDATSPIAAAIHEIATTTASRTPAAASQASGPAPGRKPSTSATARPSAGDGALRTTLAA